MDEMIEHYSLPGRNTSTRTHFPAVNKKIAPCNNVSIAVGSFEYDQFILNNIFIIYF